MSSWVVLGVIAVAAVVLLTRRWSPVTRLAADDAWGRRHATLVKFWRVWVAMALTGVALVAARLAFAGDGRVAAALGRHVATPTPTASATAVTPATGATSPAAGGPTDAVALPGWLPWAVAAVVVAVVVAGVVARSRARRNLAWLYAEDEYAYEPWGGAGTVPDTDPIRTEEADDEVQGEADPGRGELDEHDEQDEHDDGGDDDDRGPGGGVVGEAAVHDLAARRRRDPRQLRVPRR